VFTLPNTLLRVCGGGTWHLGSLWTLNLRSTCAPEHSLSPCSGAPDVLPYLQDEEGLSSCPWGRVVVLNPSFCICSPFLGLLQAEMGLLDNEAWALLEVLSSRLSLKRQVLCTGNHSPSFNGKVLCSGDTCSCFPHHEPSCFRCVVFISNRAGFAMACKVIAVDIR